MVLQVFIELFLQLFCRRKTFQNRKMGEKGEKASDRVKESYLLWGTGFGRGQSLSIQNVFSQVLYNQIFSIGKEYENFLR